MTESPATRAAPDVTIVVVTWNSADSIPRLLRSLPYACDGIGAYELVIADSGSTDNTLEVVRTQAPDVTVVPLGRNVGYAAGINAGVAAAVPAPAILVLNADVWLEPGSVKALTNGLLADGVGICSPLLLHDDGSVARSLRREPTVLRALGEAVLGGERAARHPHLCEVIHDDDAYWSPRTAAWATGAALMISRKCWDAVGGFDETFFLYSEETDYALRARDAGFALQYVPDAVAVHSGGEAMTSPHLYSLLTLNRFRLYARRHGRVRAASFWCALAIGEALRAANGRPTHRAALATLCGVRPPVRGEQPA